MNAWMDFIWKQGGNLPLTPKPINLGEGERAVLPSFCREQIESIDYDKNEIIYKVLNPSLLACPVHEHKGTVQFDYDPAKDSTRMLWRIQVRPYHNFAIPVNLFTSAVTATQSQNLRKYLIQQQPGKEEDSEEEERLRHVVESHMERGFSWLLEKTVDLVNETIAADEDQQQKAWQRIHKKRDDSLAQVILEEATDAGKVAKTESWANKETEFLFGEAKKKEQPRPTLRLRKEDLPEDLR
jgi:hypothetical protein